MSLQVKKICDGAFCVDIPEIGISWLFNAWPDIVKYVIEKDYNIVIWPNELQLKDVNDMIVSGMSKAKVQTIISTNTFSKLEALTKLSYYKKC